MTASLMRPLPDQQIAIDKFANVEAALVGDSMGVGKTVTALGRDFQLRASHPESHNKATLIVSEKIGLGVWEYHLHAMGVDASRICIIDPTKRETFQAALRDLQRHGVAGTDGPYHYFVIHWDALNRVKELAEKGGAKGTGKQLIDWFHVIADEVHLAKNRKALRTTALKSIDSDFKTGCTGTPVDDKIQDVWSILHWLYPKKYRSYWRFFETHVEYETHPHGYRIPLGPKQYRDDQGDPTGEVNEELIAKFHKEIEPFYIRRTLLEINPNMPEKKHVRPRVLVKMTPRQRKQYEQLKKSGLAELESGSVLLTPNVVSMLTRLQQMALATLDYELTDLNGDDLDTWDFPNLVLTKPSPKLDAVMNLVETHEEESFVVFTQFRGMADLVQAECNSKGIPVSKIHGGITSAQKRTEIVEDFQAGRTRVFVGTIAAAGKSITLTRSHIAIFTDRSWRPSQNEQAEDRIWRRNQTETCLIYDIEAEDSVDQWRRGRIDQKFQWITKFLDQRDLDAAIVAD